MSQTTETTAAERVNRDFARKNIFSYFLPYGLLSRNALNMVMPRSSAFNTIYDPDTTLDVLADKCQRRWYINTDQIGVMRRSCYVEEKKYSYGKNDAEQGRYYQMTHSALNLLTGVINWDLETKRTAKTTRNMKAYGKSMKSTNFMPSKETTRLLSYLEMLSDSSCETAERKAEYDQVLHEAIYCWDITLLGIAPQMANEVNPGCVGLNGTQKNRACKIASIIAMFRQNQYLTYLDRRPMDTKWMIGGIYSMAEWKERMSAGKADIMSLTYHCLNKWYTDNPQSYLFADPQRELSENLTQWWNTPVFYDLQEIPQLYNYSKTDEPAATGQKNTLRNTALGVAIGVYENYMIYYGSSRKFKWHKGIEQIASKNVQDALNNYDRENPIRGANKIINHAIMFFDSIYQFETLFADLLRPKSRSQRPGNIPSPFAGMYLIPINTSGLQQLRMLMEYPPYEFMQNLIRDICEIENKYSAEHGINSRIFATHDLRYPLSYNNTPVLFAYDLEVGKLRQSLIDYQLGKEFYVACYPEQVKFIRRIMPNVKFI